MRLWNHHFLSIAFLSLAFIVGGAPSAFAQDAAKTPAPKFDIETKPVGDWIVRCNNGVEGADKKKPKRGRCEMAQSLSQTETKKRVAEINIRLSPKKGEPAVGIVALPLGVLLQYGGALNIDEGDAVKFRFTSCEPAGCFSLITLSDQLLDEMRKGNKLYLHFLVLPIPETQNFLWT